MPPPQISNSDSTKSYRGEQNLDQPSALQVAHDLHYLVVRDAGPARYVILIRNTMRGSVYKVRNGTEHCSLILVDLHTSTVKARSV